MTETQALRERFGLNHRQEAFVLKLWSGCDQTNAYWESYRTTKIPAVDSRPYNDAAANASRLARNDKVRAALDHLRKGDAERARFTRERRLEILEEIAEGRREGCSASASIQAIAEANRMTGDHAKAGTAHEEPIEITIRRTWEDADDDQDGP